MNVYSLSMVTNFKFQTDLESSCFNFITAWRYCSLLLAGLWVSTFNSNSDLLKISINASQISLLFVQHHIMSPKLPVVLLQRMMIQNAVFITLIPFSVLICSNVGWVAGRSYSLLKIW